MTEEETTTPMLTRGKTSALEILGSSNTFKKKTREKKLGIPKITPQKRFFSCNGFFDVIDCPNRIRIPVILAKKNNTIKNK